ncbi:MAG: cupin domain-containing protein, partial [bacterium]
MDAINIQDKLDLFTDQWSPKKIGELNGQQILLAKIQGEFVFHKHDDEDELFMV